MSGIAVGGEKKEGEGEGMNWTKPTNLLSNRACDPLSVAR